MAPAPKRPLRKPGLLRRLGKKAVIGAAIASMYFLPHSREPEHQPKPTILKLKKARSIPERLERNSGLFLRYMKKHGKVPTELSVTAVLHNVEFNPRMMGRLDEILRRHKSGFLDISTRNGKTVALHLLMEDAYTRLTSPGMKYTHNLREYNGAEGFGKLTYGQRMSCILYATLAQEILTGPAGVEYRQMTNDNYLTRIVLDAATHSGEKPIETYRRMKGN